MTANSFNHRTSFKILTYLIASVWVVNGLICKILNLVPRHREIVGTILGADLAAPLTIAIGTGEVLLGVWIATMWKAKVNAVIQIVLIATMNTLESILVPELLLWGRWNAVFAALFIAIIYFTNFRLINTKPSAE